MVLVRFHGFKNKIRTQQTKKEFGHLVEQLSGILERCGKHVSCLFQVKHAMQIAYSTEHTVAV